MSEILLLSEVLLFWTLATASPTLNMDWRLGGDSKKGLLAVLFYPPARAVLAAAAAAAAVWMWNWQGLILGLLTGLSVLSLFFWRQKTQEHGFLTEAELLSLVAFVLLAAGFIWWQRLGVGFPWFRFPIETGKIAFAYLTVSALIFSVWHSGNLVSGVLSKEGILPSKPAEEKASLRHGRLIGYLERLLIVVLIVQNSYEGLGFLIAAKGLIRSKELVDNRELVEYFLVGSLLSVLCAVAIGLFVRFALVELW